MNKWFIAYKSSKDDVTYLFESYTRALEHAMNAGEFDGEKSIIEHEDKIFFEVTNESLKEHKPYEIICGSNDKVIHRSVEMRSC